MKPEIVIDSQCIIGEGPVWDERTGRLYYIDIMGKKLFSWNRETVDKSIAFEQSIGFAVLREKGGFVVGLPKGIFSVDPEGNSLTILADPEPNRSEGRFNDGKVDPAGRVWGGTMPVSLDTGYGEAGPDSGLYCLDEKLQVKTMLTGVIQGNGMGWTKDTKKFYFIDTQRFCVQEFGYDILGNTLHDGRVCVTIPKEFGIPDGMTVDDDGNIWVALWGGQAVAKYCPATGEMIDKIEVPAMNVTSCCFGGDDYRDLYITTARLGTDVEKYPLAGGVFRVRTDVKGRPSYRFLG